MLVKVWQFPLLSAVFLGSLASQPTALAQSITTDGTLGAARTLRGPVYRVRQEEGRTSGNSLFHSFGQFHLDVDEEVTFESESDIRNIILRVTGGSASLINGRISAEQLGVNLFLLNPKGIVFGETASLDSIWRSVVVSTANSLVFEDGTRFAATASTPLLTVSVPIGLQFERSVKPSAGAIQIRGNGVNSAGLQILSGGTVALVGRDISLVGGNLTVPGGRIEIGSVATSGLVELTAVERGWRLGYEDIQQFGSIRLSQAASLNVDALRQSGTIRLQGGTVSLTNSAQINGTPSLDPRPSSLSIRSDQLIVSNGAVLGTLNFVGSQSGLRININTGDLVVKTDGIINGVTVLGRGADIRIRARGTVDVLSGGLISVETFGEQRGGRLSIAANQVNVNGGQISAGTTGGGASGDLEINAVNGIDVRDGLISTDSFLEDQRAGGLSLSSRQLTVGQGGSVTANVISLVSGGVGGDVNISADQVRVVDGGRISVSGLTPNTNAGDVIVTGDELVLTNGGNIDATTQQGDGGNINLNLQDRLLLRRNSRISATAGTNEAGGAGGNIQVRAPFVLAVAAENNDITANAFSGSGGRVAIDAPQGIIGFTPLSRSALQNLLNTEDLMQLDASQIPSSDITAISQTNPTLDGAVAIRSPDTDFSRGLVELPVDVLDASRQIAAQCPVAGQEEKLGSFVVSGRGSLPPSPDGVLGSEDEGSGWVTAAATSGQIEMDSSMPVPQTAVVEAQGWRVDGNGRVVLVAKESGVNLGGQGGGECSGAIAPQ
jgi:filamentous hemagglutinin family protein